MNSKTKNHDRTLATLIHLSVFSQFIIPFGNFIMPAILWSVKRKDDFIDHHGRNALNFQISLFLYATALFAIGLMGYLFLGINLSINGPFSITEDSLHIQEFSEAIPFLVWTGILTLVLLGLFILQIFAVISASLKAGDGNYYKYPLSINFLGGNNISKNPSEEKTV